MITDTIEKIAQDYIKMCNTPPPKEITEEYNVATHAAEVVLRERALALGYNWWTMVTTANSLRHVT